MAAFRIDKKMQTWIPRAVVDSSLPDVLKFVDALREASDDEFRAVRLNSPEEIVEAIREIQD